jgi:hypothetical protein
MTPGALQVTAFQENRCTDARAIFGGHALDFEQTGLYGIFFSHGES